jgi:hypothetical protein
MTDDGIDALLRVARHVAAGEELTGELMATEKVPARLRLLLAAAVLVAADRPASKKAIVEAAPAAWSATYRNHAELLEDIKTLLPALVTAQLAAGGRPAPTAADLRAQLDEAHASIERERARRAEAEEQLRHVAQYAHELHQRLKPEFDEMMREREDKVRQLRPVPESD